MIGSVLEKLMMEGNAGASAQQRIAEGKNRRSVVSRQVQANLEPKDRQFDPIAVLLAFGEDRVRTLLPIKYGRMKESPFAFFRGAVSIMAADLARLPNSGLHVQLCGDAHLQNLGSFAAPDGKLVFDLNDFDETIRGPWEWDVKRMAASFVLGVGTQLTVARHAGGRRRSARVTAGRSSSFRASRFCRSPGTRCTGSSASNLSALLCGNRSEHAHWTC